MLEVVWFVWDTVTLEELVLELDPVKTQSMQERLKQVHEHQNCESATEEYIVQHEKLNINIDISQY